MIIPQPTINYFPAFWELETAYMKRKSLSFKKDNKNANYKGRNYHFGNKDKKAFLYVQ